MKKLGGVGKKDIRGAGTHGYLRTSSGNSKTAKLYELRRLHKLLHKSMVRNATRQRWGIIHVQQSFIVLFCFFLYAVLPLKAAAGRAPTTDIWPMVGYVGPTTRHLTHKRLVLASVHRGHRIRSF